MISINSMLIKRTSHKIGFETSRTLKNLSSWTNMKKENKIVQTNLVAKSEQSLETNKIFEEIKKMNKIQVEMSEKFNRLEEKIDVETKKIYYKVVNVEERSEERLDRLERKIDKTNEAVGGIGHSLGLMSESETRPAFERTIRALAQSDDYIIRYNRKFKTDAANYKGEIDGYAIFTRFSRTVCVLLEVKNNIDQTKIRSFKKSWGFNEVAKFISSEENQKIDEVEYFFSAKICAGDPHKICRDNKIYLYLPNGDNLSLIGDADLKLKYNINETL